MTVIKYKKRHLNRSDYALQVARIVGFKSLRARIGYLSVSEWEKLLATLTCMQQRIEELENVSKIGSDKSR